jgi:hypothetical protein
MKPIDAAMNNEPMAPIPAPVRSRNSLNAGPITVIVNPITSRAPM